MSKIYVDEIAPKTAGGVVVTPTKPAFRVVRNTSGSTSNYSNAYFDIPLNEVSFNVGNHYNLSTYTFTAPVDGVYAFDIQVNMQDMESSGWVSLYLEVNGTVDSNTGSRALDDPQGGTFLSISSHDLLQLSAGDTVVPKVRTDSGDTSVQVREESRFSGFLVG